MAHNSIGLDLGSSEVRAAVVRISLRSREIIQLEREPVALDETGASSPEAVLEAAGKLMQRIETMGAGLHCAITGELASIRKIILPAGASKRLDQVLKFELDEVLPFDIEDAVYDYVETAHTAEDLVVLSASVLHEKVEDLIVGLESQSIAPREIGVATSKPNWVSFNPRSCASNNGPISEMVVRTGCPYLPSISQTKSPSALSITICRTGRKPRCPARSISASNLRPTPKLSEKPA